MATGTEFVVSLDLHFYLLNSAWLSHLDEEHLSHKMKFNQYRSSLTSRQYS